MNENPRQVAQDIIDIAFGIAHAFRLSPHHLTVLSKEDVNKFVAKQLADAGYEVETGVGTNGMRATLKMDSPKP